MEPNVTDYDLRLLDVAITDAHDREFTAEQVDKLVELFERYANLLALIRIRQIYNVVDKVMATEGGEDRADT